MSQTPNTAVAVIGIDIGKNSFHVVGHDARGAIVLRQKWSRGQVEARLANLPPCLIGMGACVGAHQNLLQRAAGPYMWVIVDRIGLSPHVRFTPDSDGRGDIPVRQLRAISEVGAESLDYFVSERQIPRQPNSGGLCDFRVDHE
jgi:hypothetical protein